MRVFRIKYKGVFLTFNLLFQNTASVSGGAVEIIYHVVVEHKEFIWISLGRANRQDLLRNLRTWGAGAEGKGRGRKEENMRKQDGRDRRRTERENKKEIS